MNIRQALKAIAQNPKEWEILIEQINEVAAEMFLNHFRRGINLNNCPNSLK